MLVMYKYKLFMISLLLTVSPASAEVYRYINNHGVVMFTDKPKNSQYVKLVKTWKGWVPQNTYSSRYQNMGINKRRHTNTIRIIAERYNLPQSLVHAVITAESAYDSDAVSRAGAVGLMQLMPATAKRYGVRNRRDPYQNINGGTKYLRDLLILFNQDMELALAAYNAGEGAVKKYNNTIPPYKETQNYVKKVLSFQDQYR